MKNAHETMVSSELKTRLPFSGSSINVSLCTSGYKLIVGLQSVLFLYRETNGFLLIVSMWRDLRIL